MAKLHEHQGKKVLAAQGIATPRGAVAGSAEEAARTAGEIGGAVVVKGLAYTTGRAAQGLIRFAETPDEAAAAAGEILGRTVRNFPVERVLVERRDGLVERHQVPETFRQPLQWIDTRRWYGELDPHPDGPCKLRHEVVLETLQASGFDEARGCRVSCHEPEDSGSPNLAQVAAGRHPR